MPRAESEATTPGGRRRQSARATKNVKKYSEDFMDPSDVDDSDGPTSGKRKQQDLDEDYAAEASPKQRRKPGPKSKCGTAPSPFSPARKVATPGSAVINKSKEKQKETQDQDDGSLKCAVCKSSLQETNAKFHYSVHYYEENAFIDILKPKDLKDGKAQDETGSTVKYTCPHKGCTKRKMGYKEICVHLATAHQQLKELMMTDNRIGIKAAMDKLFPPVVASPVKVKKEVGSSAPMEAEDNSEDVDDPTEKTTKRPSVTTVTPRVTTVTPRGTPTVTPRGRGSNAATTVVKTEGGGAFKTHTYGKRHDCLICNGPGKTSKEGRNMNLGSGLTECKYHYTVCAYGEGGLVEFIDHGQGADVEFEKLEEFGVKFRYKCPFVDCPKNSGRTKAIGYKEYAIHCATAHNQIERWMKKQLDEDIRPALKEVYDALIAAREEAQKELEDLPPVVVEEMHTCLICGGEDKSGRNLSMEKSKMVSTRYHYASCYYDEGVYYSKYPPGDQNSTEDGQPRDILGREVKYSCQERGCTVKRKMGYREFSVHMSNEHGGLEEVMRADQRPEVRAMADKMKK